MCLSDSHLNILKDLSGPKGWQDDPREMSAYLTEPRGKYQGKTALVLLPDNTQKVADIVRYCAQHQIAIVPQSGNTGLVGGSIPTLAGDQILISLKRMNRMRHTDPDNQSMTVEAGCILADVQQRARDIDCIFPLSLAAEGSCMIGGNLSTNAGGVNVLHYGNARNLVLGLEVVLPSGEIWHGLTGLRKDNTGYDLKQLFIGAEGTLGIITAATLKLSPYPHQKQTAFVAVPDPKSAVELLSIARRVSGGCITAFELVPRRGLEMVTHHMPGCRDPLETAYDWYVLLETTSSLNRDLLDLERVMERILEDALQKDLVLDGVIAKNDSESEALWGLREHLSEAQKHEGGSIKHDISVAISTIPEFLLKAADIVEALIPGARPVPFGHLGDGNLHYNVSQPREMAKSDFLECWEDLNRHIHDLVKDFHGSFSAEHGIGRMKTTDMARYKSSVELDMMRRIKAALDPEDIMNPGVILPAEISQEKA
ncbi:FAD-binding oxidoreductase [Paremcibacter congregatus]|uniref:FAD-binding oxidoreductase n=1 Tax=Paremcibacter congregatus TaxID=2043170 RepID=UPI003A92A73B